MRLRRALSAHAGTATPLRGLSWWGSGLTDITIRVPHVIQRGTLESVAALFAAGELALQLGADGSVTPAMRDTTRDYWIHPDLYPYVAWGTDVFGAGLEAWAYYYGAPRTFDPGTEIFRATFVVDVEGKGTYGPLTWHLVTRDSGLATGPVTVDPNDGSALVQVQPGGSYTCPASAGPAGSPGIEWAFPAGGTTTLNIPTTPNLDLQVAAIVPGVAVNADGTTVPPLANVYVGGWGVGVPVSYALQITGNVILVTVLCAGVTFPSGPVLGFGVHLTCGSFDGWVAGMTLVAP